MSGTSIVTAIIEILVSGLKAMGEGIGSGLYSMVQSIFLTGTGESQTLSTFGILIVVFAAISLAIGLSRWVVNFGTSLGQRNR